MSISDLIVVMKEGVVQQIGKPQNIYDDPINLFVAKFLGTPPINVFNGNVQNETLYIGDAAVLKVPGAPDGNVYVGVRPEGFIPMENGDTNTESKNSASCGALVCELSNVEVMGRDVSVVARHSASVNPIVRSIINSDFKIDTETETTVSYALKPNKVFLFDATTEERIPFEVK